MFGIVNIENLNSCERKLLTYSRFDRGILVLGWRPFQSTNRTRSQRLKIWISSCISNRIVNIIKNAVTIDNDKNIQQELPVTFSIDG